MIENIQYEANRYYQGSPLIYFFYHNPFEIQERFSEYRNKPDNEKPPKRESGDLPTIIGTIVGLIAGGILGGILGNHYLNLISGIFCATGGIIIGGILGALTGDRISKRRKSKSRHTEDSPEALH